MGSVSAVEGVYCAQGRMVEVILGKGFGCTSGFFVGGGRCLSGDGMGWGLYSDV